MPNWKQSCSILMLCALLLCSRWFVAPVHAQSPLEADESWHFRYDLLQMLLEERGLQVGKSLTAALKSPRDSVIVIVGDRPRLSNNEWGSLIGFVINGGTLLVASDSSFTLPGVGNFSKGPVITTAARNQYQQFEDCIRIAADSPNFEGVSEIVTNRSGWFTPNPTAFLEWEVVAAIPSLSRPASSQGSPLLAVGRWGEKEEGRVIACADASIFSNGMLWHGDNAFAAIRVSDLLCSEGKSQLAFLSDGELLDSYRTRINPADELNPPPELPEVPEPELKKVLRLANAIAKDVAESNIMNEALKQRPRGISPSNYFRALLYLVAIILLIGTVVMILRSGTFQAMFLPPRTMRSAYEMREYANSHTDDFRNSAGYLARDFCWELTGSRHTGDWQKFLAGLMSNSSSMNKTEYQELARIIDIACRGRHTKMSSFEFQQLGKSISIQRAKWRAGGPLACAKN